ncbi:MAG: CinA family protein [Pontibacterium sp.]
MDKQINDLVMSLAEKLENKGWMVTTAESCTGGAIAMNLTEAAGASAWFDAAFVTYSNRMKQKVLAVSEATLTEFGAVSEPVVREMAEGALQRAEADIAVAVSGIAGPGGGSAEKPVGTVCFGWACRGEAVMSATYYFGGDRHEVRQQAVVCALKGLISKIH